MFPRWSRAPKTFGISITGGGAAQGFADAVVGRDVGEEGGGQLGDLPALIGFRAETGQRGAGADTLQRLAAQNVS